MADFDVDFDSISELISSLNKADLFDEETQRKLLSAAADELMDAVREESNRSGFDLKQITTKLSKSKKIKRDKTGDSYVTVTVSGKNQRGERNATVAFVLNYGRSEKYGIIKGSYFWTRAAKRSSKTVLDTYEKTITQELKERKLI